MNVEIINKRRILGIHGFSGTAVGKDYAGTAFKLMDKMWKVVKSNNLKHKGLNIWVYEGHENVFAGVELEDPMPPNAGLEYKNIVLDRYAYHKHVGPYQLIKTKGRDMRGELERRGVEIISPYIEIYGHWTDDESKLETELLMAIK